MTNGQSDSVWGGLVFVFAGHRFDLTLELLYLFRSETVTLVGRRNLELTSEGLHENHPKMCVHDPGGVVLSLEVLLPLGTKTGARDGRKDLDLDSGGLSQNELKRTLDSRRGAILSLEVLL